MATKVKPSRLNITGTPQVGQVPVYVDADSFQWGSGGGAGDVVGPNSSTDEDVVVFDGATGKLIKDSGVKLSSKLDASALSDNNYGGAWENDSTHTPTKRVLYDKIHTMDVEIGNKAADTAVVKLTGNQTINGTKTFGTSPVVPNKTTDATNTGTAIATEAQVYKKQDTLVSGTNIKTVKGTSLLGSGNIAINEVPSSGTTGYVLTKTSSGYGWSAPTGGIQLDANSPITVSKLRVGTEAQYSALGSYDNSTIYMTV